MNKPEFFIPLSVLRAIISLDEKSGNLYWMERDASMFKAGKYSAERSCHQWNCRHSGKPALNAEDKHGYLRGTIFGKHIKAHRVVYAIFYGRWPEDDVDHINGIRCDNRPENLRDVSRSENMKNSAARSNTLTGNTGVTFRSDCQKYRAHISVDGRFRHLGYFETEAEACLARTEANKTHGYHENHGRKAL